MGGNTGRKIEEGSRAPDFELRSDSGGAWRLSDQLGSVVALLFYPGDETLMCTRQLCSVRDHWQEYLETKAVIVGVSPGPPDQHAAFSARHRLPIPLLADADSGVTETYCSHWLFPLFFMRGIVVIDAKGMVRTRRTMLRAFRPTDRSVITAIYAARGDALQDRYRDLADRGKS
ncbi:MAG TPA: peroxiredoxin [Pyrinomonadaceae bacterium]|nr:peroxiredoxin [Pyrinomonadaceae bacterium]